MKLKFMVRFRKALREYAIQIGFDYEYLKNNPNMVIIKCMNKCDWRICCSHFINKNALQIKRFKSNHNCGRQYNHKKISVYWITIKYLETFRDSLNIYVTKIIERIRRKHNVVVSIDKCLKAKKEAFEIVRGKENK